MITTSQILNADFMKNGISDATVVADLIENHSISQMKEGVRYYNNKNDILNRRQFRYENGVKVDDDLKQNKKIPHNWHKLLVDQKVSYLSGNPIKFNADSNEATAFINRMLGEKFDDCLCELVKNSANKGVEWLQVFIDENGKFDFAIIPAEQVVPIWDTHNQKKLTGVIRYFELETSKGKRETSIEWWNSQTVKCFLKNSSGKISYLGETPHFMYAEKGYGWGRVPFIPFKNNEEMLGDLTFYKQLIDDYDFNISDLSNNLSEIQEAVTVLKGYEGTNLREFSENLRFYKIIKVSGADGSGVDKLELSIPVDAKRELLNRLKQSIFMFGQGVDITTEHFNTSISGVALKFLYSLLDTKCSVTERKFTVAIKELLWFLSEFAKMMNICDFSPESVAVLFNKRILSNDKEQAEIAVMSRDIISDKTIAAHHPWTEDVDCEV